MNNLCDAEKTTNLNRVKLSAALPKVVTLHAKCIFRITLRNRIYIRNGFLPLFRGQGRLLKNTRQNIHGQKISWHGSFKYKKYVKSYDFLFREIRLVSSIVCKQKVLNGWTNLAYVFFQKTNRQWWTTIHLIVTVTVTSLVTIVTNEHLQ
jgi:hypothetical protein